MSVLRTSVYPSSSKKFLLNNRRSRPDTCCLTTFAHRPDSRCWTAVAHRPNRCFWTTITCWPDSCCWTTVEHWPDRWCWTTIARRPDSCCQFVPCHPDSCCWTTIARWPDSYCQLSHAVLTIAAKQPCHAVLTSVLGNWSNLSWISRGAVTSLTVKNLIQYTPCYIALLQTEFSICGYRL